MHFTPENVLKISLSDELEWKHLVFHPDFIWSFSCHPLVRLLHKVRWAAAKVRKITMREKFHLQASMVFSSHWLKLWICPKKWYSPDISKSACEKGNREPLNTLSDQTQLMKLFALFCEKFNELVDTSPKLWVNKLVSWPKLMTIIGSSRDQWPICKTDFWW